MYKCIMFQKEPWLIVDLRKYSLLEVWVVSMKTIYIYTCRFKNIAEKLDFWGCFYCFFFLW